MLENTVPRESIGCSGKGFGFREKGSGHNQGLSRGQGPLEK